MIQATVGNSMAIPLKTRNKTTIYPGKTIIQKHTYILVFMAAQFTIAKTRKQSRCPLTDEWVKKPWYIYTMEYYPAIKRNTFESVLMRWVNLELIIQSEVKSGREI